MTLEWRVFRCASGPGPERHPWDARTPWLDAKEHRHQIRPIFLFVPSWPFLHYFEGGGPSAGPPQSIHGSDPLLRDFGMLDGADFVALANVLAGLNLDPTR